MTLSDDQLREAVLTGVRMWAALADDDHEALLGLLTAGLLDALGTGDMEPGRFYGPPQGRPVPPLAGLATRIRDHLGIDRANCRRIGWVDQACVLEGDELRIAWTIADEVRAIEPGELQAGWRMELTLDEGCWLIDPVRAHDPAGHRHGRSRRGLRQRVGCRRDVGSRQRADR